jgi:hypothetical protein
MGAGLAEEAGAGGHPSAVGATSPSEERFGAAGPPGGDLAAGDIVDRAAADFGNCGNFPLGELAGFEETLDEEDLFDGKHDLGSQRREFRAGAISEQKYIKFAGLVNTFVQYFSAGFLTGDLASRKGAKAQRGRGAEDKNRQGRQGVADDSAPRWEERGKD